MALYYSRPYAIQSVSSFDSISYNKQSQDKYVARNGRGKGGTVYFKYPGYLAKVKLRYDIGQFLEVIKLRFKIGQSHDFVKFRFVIGHSHDLLELRGVVGQFHEFVEDEDVRLIGVEAAGEGVDSKKHAATLTKGSPGVLHGAFSYLLQDEEGQIIDPHSISAG